MNLAGFWGTHTATRDWCEPNYVHTPYIAEFWNTSSNLLYIVFALNLMRHKRRFSGIHRFNEFKSLSVTICGMFILGLASGAFHATLKYWPQVMDRLFCAIPLLGLSSGFRELDNKSTLTIVGILADCFGAILAMLVLFEAYILYLAIHDLYSGYMIASKTAINEVEFHAMIAVVFFVVALVAWCADIFICDSFVQRFHFTPHFHALWHVLTALAFHNIALIQIHLFLFKTCKQSPQFETRFGALLITGVKCVHKDDLV